MHDPAVTPAEAQRYFDAGKLGVADLFCRALAQRDPAEARVPALLARIAARVGEWEVAQGFSEDARRLGLSVPPELSGDTAAAPPPPSTAQAAGERYLLIKAWGNGFCSDLDHTLGHLLLAEMTGRTPVIHWGRNSLFGGAPDRDAFREYFEPVSPLAVRDLIGKGHDFFPPKWTDSNLLEEDHQKREGEWSRLAGIQFLNRPERVVVADFHAGVVTLLPWLRPGHPLHGVGVEGATRALVSKYLRVRPSIFADIVRFASRRLTRRPVIAAHIRGSDKRIEDPDLDRKVAVYPEIIGQFARGRGEWTVFLLTDSEPIRERFVAMYPGRVITTECIRTDTDVGLHYQNLPDKVRLGVEVVRDAWLAARCDGFIGMGASNVSCLVHHLRDWAPGRSIMIGPMMTHLTNPYLYMSREELARHMPADPAIQPPR